MKVHFHKWNPGSSSPWCEVTIDSDETRTGQLMQLSVEEAEALAIEIVNRLAPVRLKRRMESFDREFQIIKMKKEEGDGN